MDFLKQLLELNNKIYLNELAKKQNLNEEEKIKFIQNYNKRNNRLFIPCKKYRTDDYKTKIKRYKLSTSSSSS